MFFPNPEGMELHPWADAVCFSMINYPNAWALGDEDWQTWGSSMFFHDPFLSRYDPPNPYDYQDWQEWGRKLADSMSAAPAAPNSGGQNPGPTDLGALLISQTGFFLVAQNGAFLRSQ